MPALSDATVSPAPAPAAPAAEVLPSPLLDVQKGAVPGILLPPLEQGKETDLQNFVVDNFDKLTDWGLDYVELPDLTTAIYNSDKIKEPDVLKLAEEGKIAQVLPVADKIGAPVAPQTPQNSPAPAAAPQIQPSAPQGGVLAGASVPSGPNLTKPRLAVMAPAKPNTPGQGPSDLVSRRAL